MITAKFRKALAAHPLCRPPLTGRQRIQIRRLDGDGKWKTDNGAGAAVWIGARANGDAIVWIAECACTDYGLCPLATALEHAVELDCPSTSVECVPTVRTSLVIKPAKKPAAKTPAAAKKLVKRS